MSIAVWWKVARPFTLSATLSPLLVGSAAASTELARNSSPFRTGLFLCALLSCLFLQIAANYFNEYFDWRYGLDSEASLGASTVIFRGEMTSRQVLGGGILCICAGIMFSRQIPGLKRSVHKHFRDIALSQETVCVTT